MSYCFCTLALGIGYAELAAQLAGDLARYARDARFIVLTDAPEILAHCSNVDAVFHRQRSTLGYNDKLAVISRVLEHYDTAIFVDADSRILGPVQLDPRVLMPGVRAWLVRNWGFMLDTYDRSQQAPGWQSDDLRMMKLLKERYGLGDREREIPCVVEVLFSVTKGTASETKAFLERWNSLAELCERSGFYRHEGYALGLAAELQSFPIEQAGLEGIPFFEPLKSARFDVPDGMMSKAEYDTLLQTIVRYKGKSPQIISSRLAALRTRARRLRIKCYGLDLIH
jgi:hypothetical protein